jgi:site-specific DNA-methyltransferase (adenine-specific)
MYGSGFPKSLDVSKAIDKAAGAERERTPYKGGIASGQGNYGGGGQIHDGTKVGNEAITPEAKQWEGWGTALKPAFEPIVVARKPLIGTVAENVLEHGTGGLNIDGSRIGTSKPKAKNTSFNSWRDLEGREDRQEPEQTYDPNQGRWPANVILDEYSAELVDEQSGISVSRPSESGGYLGNSLALGGSRLKANGSKHNDSGGASRFFYVAKASKRDRNEGLEDLEAKLKPYGNRNPEDVPEEGDPKGSVNDKFTTQPAKNFHPTVKPTDLMRYLVKLVTPLGGTVLGPFTGSGSTGKAAILEGFRFIGCELTEDYIPIIEGRLAYAEATKAEEELKKDEALF